MTTTNGVFLSANHGAAWGLFNYAGTLTDGGISLGTMPSLGAGLSWSVDTSIANQVNVVVPEPNFIALLGGFGVLALMRCLRN